LKKKEMMQGRSSNPSTEVINLRLQHIEARLASLEKMCMVALEASVGTREKQTKTVGGGDNGPVVKNDDDAEEASRRVKMTIT
jgi:hypothetical protein